MVHLIQKAISPSFRFPRTDVASKLSFFSEFDSKSESILLEFAESTTLLNKGFPLVTMAL